VQIPSLEANNHTSSQQISALYGSCKFITMITTAHHWTRSWARLIQPTLTPYFFDIILHYTPIFCIYLSSLPCVLHDLITLLIFGEENKLWSSHPDQLWSPPSLLFNGYWGFFRGLSDWGVKLTTHPYIVLRLRMHGAVPPLPHMSSWHGA
jgi:hypothetical protein